MISSGTPVAKAAYWVSSDAEVRKPGERRGLDTPVVLAVNVEHLIEGPPNPALIVYGQDYRGI